MFIKKKLVFYTFLNFGLVTLLFDEGMIKKEGHNVVFSFLFVLILCTYLFIDFIRKIPRNNARLSHLLIGTGLLISLIILSYSNLYLQTYRIYGSKAFTGKTLSSGDFLYYSITTFTTTGYGDITSVGTISNALAASEMLFGGIINTILIAVLTSILLNRLKE